MKTIIHLTRRFYPDFGGVESHLLSISKLLVRDGHKVIIITESQSNGRDLEKWQKDLFWQERNTSAKMTGRVNGIAISGKTNEEFNKKSSSLSRREKSKESTESGIKNEDSLSTGPGIIVYRLPKVKEGWTKKIHIWMSLWNIRHLFRISDIVHAHDVFFWYIPFRFLYWTKKVYITFHGFEGVYPPHKKAVIIRKISEWMAHGNIIVGDYIRKWYKTRPTYVIYGAVDSTHIKNVPSRPYDRKKPLVITFMGRLEYDTGVPLYLDALKLLQKKGIPFTFQTLGDGSLRPQVAKIGTAHGFISNVESFLSESDIILAASYLTIMQCLFYKRPIISVYQHEMKKDILRMTPFAQWIDITNSPSEIVTVIESIYNGTYKRAYEEGYAWAKEQTWENVYKIYLQLWGIKPKKI